MGKRKKRKKSKWSVFFRPIKVILFVFLTVMVLGSLAGGVLLLKYQDEIALCREKADMIIAKTQKTDFTQPSDTRIYDSAGVLIGTINSGHYEYVPIAQISRNLQNAYIAQEDRRFYEHNGVDYIGLARAGVALIKHRGAITQGGSTITQQVIKNTYLTQERTFERKLIEFFAAPQMEAKYSKELMLEFYCNTNFYANRCYGVAEASRYYFDKEAKDLTIWEAATLAGLSNNPSRYDPVAHPDASKKKRDQVIDNMALCEFITEGEQAYAKSQPLTVAKIYEPQTPETYQTTYAVYCAAIELMKNEGFTFQYVFQNKASYDAYKEKYQELYQSKSDMIRSGGYEIHTSLDSDMQLKLQETVDSRLKDFKEVQDNGKLALQGAAVCIDNRSGYVTAIVGGRGTEDEYNRGFLSKRQPGSTIKPLIDYAPAFETGYYYPSRMVNDHLFEDGPKNSSGKYFGDISVREALNRSLNTVAWQVLDDIGVNTGIGYLGKMHFVGLSYLDNGNNSMSIGGFTEGARVVDMARGYSVLANKGMLSNNTCITSIVSQFDGEVYNKAQADERIFTEDIAYMVTDVLKGTLDKPYGTGSGLGLSIPAAGKTGTTNSNKDTWFCGYTKYYTTAVWVGYDTPRAMPGVYGKTYAGRIWHDFMSVINEGLPSMDWDMPRTVSLENVDSRGEKTDRKTGKTDLFSSVAEAVAKADKEKWKEVEERKKKEAQEAKRNEAAQNQLSGAEQIAQQVSALIGELNSLQVKDSSATDKLNSARGLLEQINGTPQYEGLKQQLDSAAAYISSLPGGMEETTGKPQEIGPGVNGPGEGPGPLAPTPGETVQEVGPGVAPSDSGPGPEVEAVGPGMG